MSLLKVDPPCRRAAVTSQFGPKATWGSGDLVIPELLVWALRGLAEREQEQMRVREELDFVRRKIDGK